MARRSAWPPGFDRTTYGDVIRHAILGAKAKAELAAESCRSSVDATALRNWLLSLSNVERIWIEEGGLLADTAVEMVQYAFDATVIADANAPARMHEKVDGGLTVQWIRLLDALDPKWSSRKPKTAVDLARRLVVEWTLSNNPDRTQPSACSALDVASANLLFQAVDGPGMTSMVEVLGIAYEEIDAAIEDGHMLPYSRRRLDRWSAFAQRKSTKSETVPPVTSGMPVTETGQKAAVAAAVAGAATTMTAQEVAATVETAANTVVDTATSLDRTLVSVVSSLDRAFEAANRFVEHAVGAVVQDTRRRRKRS